MVELYQARDLKLDELITATYTLDQINQGYQDLLDGENIRGVILHDGPEVPWTSPMALRARRPVDHWTTVRRAAAGSARCSPCAGRPDVVIEGPPGTGKSTLLRDIARQAGPGGGVRRGQR